MAVLNRIHHIGGMWHQTALFNIWGLFTGLVSVALIGLACSGIYMWYKLRMDRVAGIALLAISIGGGMTLLILMRTA